MSSEVSPAILCFPWTRTCTLLRLSLHGPVVPQKPTVKRWLRTPAHLSATEQLPVPKANCPGLECSRSAVPLAGTDLLQANGWYHRTKTFHFLSRKAGCAFLGRRKFFWHVWRVLYPDLCSRDGSWYIHNKSIYAPCVLKVHCEQEPGHKIVHLSTENTSLTGLRSQIHQFSALNSIQI